MDSMILKCPSLRGDETLKSLALMGERSCRLRQQYSPIARHEMSTIKAIVSLLSPYGHVLAIRQGKQATAAVSESICSHSSLMICAVGQKCQGLQPQLG
jgi:hypothetical protein